MKRVPDRWQSYRRWAWKRLSLLLPSFGAALGVDGWLGLESSCPRSIRIPCLSLAVLLSALIGYWTFVTLACSRRNPSLHLQQTRALRRHLGSWGPSCVTALLLLALLALVPVLFSSSSSDPLAASSVALIPRTRRVPASQRIDPAGSAALKDLSKDASRVPEPAQRKGIPEAALASAPAETSKPVPPGTEGSNPVPAVAEGSKHAPIVAEEPKPLPALAEESKPVPPIAERSNSLPPIAEGSKPGPAVAEGSKPELRPELAWQPSHLNLDEKEPRQSDRIEVPYVPTRSTVPVEPPPFEEALSPFRTDPDLFGRWPDATGFWVGLQYRPLPDESDPEGGVPPEARVDGFLLLGSGGERVPGLMMMLDLPIGRNDSILVSWMGAILPEPDREGGDRPNWSHVTLAYSYRLAGYSRHATLDLAVSLGASADFFRRAEGIPDPGVTPKIAPYAGIDLAFWQHEPFGILFHLGEAFPATLLGSALGMTDFSVEVRWDLSERVSLHAGYRMLLLHYKPDEAPPRSDPLHQSLSGPILGLDFRF